MSFGNLHTNFSVLLSMQAWVITVICARVIYNKCVKNNICYDWFVLESS